MTKRLIATVISAALVIAPVPALTATSAAPTPQKPQASNALQPGKPAGIQQAQGDLDQTDILFGAGIAGALGLGFWALSKNNKTGGGGTPPSTVPSSTPSSTP